MAKRRVKPPGYERWTWAEIDAGRRMSRSEKRWNRAFKGMGWERNSNGSYTPPNPAAATIAVLMFLLMAVVGFMGDVMNRRATRHSVGGEFVLVYLSLLLAIPVLMLMLVAASKSPPPDSTAPRPRRGEGGNMNDGRRA